MTAAIPKGTTIGRIETSLHWLLSHTSRLQGAIMIRVPDGKGFILIDYGRPAAFMFRLGDRVIRGEAARQILARYDVLDASLRRYTDGEFREAMALVGTGAGITGHRMETAAPPPFMNMFDDLQGAGKEAKSRPAGPATRNPDQVGEGPVTGKDRRDRAAVSAVPEREQTSENVLDRIADTPGVSAVAIFRKGVIVDSRGDAFLEDLVEPAEEVLLSVFEVLALLSTGPLVQVTIRLSGSTVTISPFNDGYLLVLTHPGINLGQIRKLVHDVAEIGTAW